MIDREALRHHLPQEGEHWDVLVAGAGPAGLGAALAAARLGARTLVLEARSALGGEAPLGLWMPVNRLQLDLGSRGGVHQTLVDHIRTLDDFSSFPVPEDGNNGDGLSVHPEYFKQACFEALEKAGCHYRLYSPVTGTLLEGDRVTGVAVTGKNGVEHFTADVVVDATGDGDVAYHAGAEMVTGREEDGLFMPQTLGFALCNVDVERILEFRSRHEKEFYDIVARAAREGSFTLKSYWISRTTIPGAVFLNTSGTGLGPLDGTKGGDLTLSEREGLQAALDFVAIARRYAIPGLEHCHLLRTGAQVGVRETRRIVGEYVFTAEDAQACRRFPDVISRKYGAVDAIYYFARMGSGCDYPYRSLLPRRIENLLVAGRCGSATHLGHASGKSMGNMMGLGQAAGVAAALCADQGIAPRTLEPKAVQDVLVGWGVKLFD